MAREPAETGESGEHHRPRRGFGDNCDVDEAVAGIDAGEQLGFLEAHGDRAAAAAAIANRRPVGGGTKAAAAAAGIAPATAAAVISAAAAAAALHAVEPAAHPGREA